MLIAPAENVVALVATASPVLSIIWPLLPPVDVLFIRNVLIYFDVPTKKAILGKVARVLRPGGILLWVNVSGPDTPIHLTTTEVVAALPFEVEGVESTAGAGTWCALRRIR